MAYLGTLKPTHLLSLTDAPASSHPDYKHYLTSWQKIRHCQAGEDSVKALGKDFLPSMGSMTDKEYKDFVARATFHNMVGPTVGAYTGKLFRRKPNISNIPARLEDKLETISRDGESLRSFMESVVDEQSSVGRAGILVDIGAADTTNPNPYLCLFHAENITNWGTVVINGRKVLSKVELREITQEDEMDKHGNTITKNVTRYRKLVLEDGVYKQYLYKTGTGATPSKVDSMKLEPGFPVTPTISGKPFDYIPFFFAGAKTNTPDVDKPTVSDIANLNISHYRSYAQLEHGLFYTGMPIYYSQVSGGASDEVKYKIGPSTVWEVGQNCTPGILEFNGHGLGFIQNSLDIKEQQIATVGGRMLGVRGQAVSESDNQLQMKEENEATVLWSIANRLDEAMTKAVRVWAEWNLATKAEVKKITIELNKDFMLDGIGARELRAIQAMYQDGIIPIEVFYDYMRKSEVIPDYIDLEEFKKMVQNTDNFPANPDLEARYEGFPDAKAKLDYEQKEKDRKEAKAAAKQAALLAGKALEKSNINESDQNEVDPNEGNPNVNPKKDKPEK